MILRPSLFVALLVAGNCVATSLAQDVTVTPPAWLDDENVAGDTPPTFKRQPRVTYPRELREGEDIGYVMIVQSVDAKGARLLPGQGASHPYLQRAVFESMRDSVDQRAAVKDGKPVDSLSWYAVIFNPASAAPKGPDGTPRLLAVSPVLVPRKEMGKIDLSKLPVVWGTLALDASGQPQGLTLGAEVEPFREAIEASLPNWRFAPARQAGQPTPAEIRVPFVLQPPMSPGAVERGKPPRVVKRVPPVYPRALRVDRMRGEVVVTFEVGVDGKVHNAVVKRSSHPAFDEPALDAIRQWRFEPAERGGKPVKTSLSVPIVFSLQGEPDGGAETARVSRGEDQSKLPEEFRFDFPPKPRGTAMPVYPWESFAAGGKGKAKVVILVGPDGKVQDVRVVEATEPEFGLALAAMAELMVFEPALKDNQPTQALLRMEREFNSSKHDSWITREDRALLRLEQRSPEKIVSLAQLDAPLQPISRRPPQFPVKLRASATEGEALVEFLVGEDGRVRLPRVISATAPEFGYAAVQAVAAWEYEPPRVGGKTAVVRARVPFVFNTKDSAGR